MNFNIRWFHKLKKSRLNLKTRHRLYTILLINFIAIIFVLLVPTHHAHSRKNSTNLKQNISSSVSQTKRKVILPLDIPLENQFSQPALGNGCEVTALSMLLNYYGYQTNKNKLAKLLNYVPVIDNNGLHGNPHEGFVGEIQGGDLAMGVDVEPVADVAKSVIVDKYKVIQSSSTSLNKLLSHVRRGTPVWVKVTVDFQPTNDTSFMYWQTSSGIIKVCPNNHASVITGFDKNTIFVNDPYGYKNRKVPRKLFEQIFTSLGSQSLYLV